MLVTGACGLLGEAFVKAIAGQQGKVVITDIDVLKGKQLCQEINQSYPEEVALFQQLDITDRNMLRHCIHEVVAKFGKIDALVNNAYPRNQHYGRDFFDVEFVDFCENINAHLGGYFLAGQQFAQYFIKQGFGNIINIASIYGIIAPKFHIYADTTMTTPVEYALVKSAVVHLTKFMASKLAGHNIRVNTLSLGGILARQPDRFLDSYRRCCFNKGMLEPEDVVGGLLFLLSDMSLFINGQNIVIDDGFTVA